MRADKLGRVALSVALNAALAACSSDQAKSPPTVATPAPMVAVAPKPAPPPVAQPTAQKPVAANPLRDPASILAKRSIYYDFDSYAVRPEFRPMVEAHAAYVKEHLGASVLIEGNGDERGSREYNLALGQRRADGVKSLMVMLGAPERQIETVSFGEEKPVATGHDEASWAQNRHSDIVYKKEQ